MALPYSRIVGLFVVSAGVVAVAVLLGVGLTQGWVVPKITVYAIFNEAQFVKSADPVTLSGFAVGEVGKLALTDDLRVIAELRIERRYMVHLSKTTVAHSVPPLVLGPGRIQLIPDPTGLPLSPGDTLATKQTQDAMVLMETLQKILPTVDHTLLNVQELTKNAAVMSGALAHPDSSLMRIMRASADLTELLSAGDGLIPALISEASFKAQADSTLAAAADATRDLGGLLESVDRLMASTDSLLHEANTIAKIFGESAPQMTRELIPALRELRLTLESARSSWLLGGETQDPAGTPGTWRIAP
jgi:ABC-type transporter Mla subunit MlaD